VVDPGADAGLRREHHVLFPAIDCMAAGSPSGCCETASGNAGTCGNMFICGGTNSTCHGQKCS
jgi:hypothetical protein